MSFKRVHSGEQGRVSVSFRTFNGSNFGYSPCDQPNEYAYITDFQCHQNQLKLREGCRKNEVFGYSYDIAGLFPVNIYSEPMMGIVTNGNLSVFFSDDIVAGTEYYYTWDEIRQQFTWDTLRNKTWKDIRGN